MDEKQLFRIAFICTFIGLIGVIAASQLIEVKTISIEEAKQAKEGSYVKITGNVINIRQTQAAFFLDVADNTGEITIVAFPDNKGLIQKEVLPAFMDKGSNVTIEGKTSIYKGMPEIMAEKIEAISF
ncbi:MAG: OB-fold nucleic acid binding domain-containing protein [Nanoarchaeota archaeon]|nr:OB-fold nucleic acid binding domain-containing protein [Nanoarchaeota archaeon]